MRKIIILLQGIAFHMLDVLSRSVQTPLLKEIDQSGTHISRVILIENLKDRLQTLLLIRSEFKRIN